MGRFILRFRGQGPLPDDIVRQVRQLPETQILEETDRIKAGLGQSAPAKVVPIKPVCPSCGATFEKSLKFCGECGKPMGAAS